MELTNNHKANHIFIFQKILSIQKNPYKPNNMGNNHIHKVVF